MAYRVGSGAIRFGFEKKTTGLIRRHSSPCPHAAPNAQRPRGRLEIIVPSRPPAATWKIYRRWPYPTTALTHFRNRLHDTSVWLS